MVKLGNIIIIIFLCEIFILKKCNCLDNDIGDKVKYERLKESCIFFVYFEFFIKDIRNF